MPVFPGNAVVSTTHSRRLPGPAAPAVQAGGEKGTFPYAGFELPVTNTNGTASQHRHACAELEAGTLALRDPELSRQRAWRWASAGRALGSLLLSGVNKLSHSCHLCSLNNIPRYHLVSFLTQIICL